ncbi:uncharacterized protein FFB20_01537 [Fusarium fujikuroi]|nr:uncharacterized protein FFB20_01537 [Fusarium fujikuroi]SCO12436.1 uncharacterized protein FFC1_11760 [Fusarium fujikuroi]SCO15305.1 uncharacterized protein FFE2_13266 [Fusarium fujikuroi]SCO23257.1 uncharacterized protein FFM5_13300 [Fusarium fujikuroi]SCO40138.1 uncharacterized protein FFNC_07321 [Fusarium fujikuroi]
MCIPFSTRRQDPVDPPPRYYKNYDSQYPVSSSSAYSRQRDQARTNRINEMNAASKASRARNKRQMKSFLLRNPGGGAIITHHGCMAGAIAGGAGGF